jgi:hypothetical protein
MTGRFISYLDLMCCGFGGAMLMFFIVSSAQSSRNTGLPMLVIRAKVVNENGLTPDQAIEFGIQYRKRGDEKWIRANGTMNHESIAGDSGEAWFFNSLATSNNGSEALFICNRPKSGVWEARAYSATTSTEEDISNLPQSPGFRPVLVQLEVLGAVATSQRRSTISGSAEFTEPVVFEIRGRD